MPANQPIQYNIFPGERKTGDEAIETIEYELMKELNIRHNESSTNVPMNKNLSS